MARLPQPGGDEGNWGEILNDYLLAIHQPDGTLRAGAVSAGAIKNSSLEPAKLRAANLPVAGQVLTYDGDVFRWKAASTGTSDHGALSGLGDDDHLQYHTDARGDARYYTQTQVDAALNAKADDNAAVHTAGDETIGGEKTFTNGLNLAQASQSAADGLTLTQSTGRIQLYNTTGNDKNLDFTGGGFHVGHPAYEAASGVLQAGRLLTLKTHSATLGGIDFVLKDTSRVYFDGSGDVRIGPGGSDVAPAARLEIDSEVPGSSGVRLTQLTSAATFGVSSGKALSVDAEGDVILVDQPAADPAMGGDLSGTAATAQLKDGVVSDANVAATANIAQEKIANLAEDLAAKADDGTVLHNNGDNVVALPNSSTQFVRVDIPDDGTASDTWPDRHAHYFNGNRTGYFNEYGEIRARAARASTVALRAMAYSSGSNGDIFQVTNAGRDKVYLGISESKLGVTLPINSTADITTTGNITAPNVIPRADTYDTEPAGGTLREISINYPLETTNPDVEQVNVEGVKASWRNEWGALRGTSPYANGFGDALVRAIRTDSDVIANGMAFEIADRRTGVTNNTMWGRRWTDGVLVRNGITMNDSIVLNASDPVPANLPAGTIIVRVG